MLSRAIIYYNITKRLTLNGMFRCYRATAGIQSGD